MLQYVTFKLDKDKNNITWKNLHDIGMRFIKKNMDEIIFTIDIDNYGMFTITNKNDINK